MRNGVRFKRYIDGEMTPGEAIEFMEWLVGKEAIRDIDYYLSEEWDKTLTGPNEYDHDRIYLRVKQDLIRLQQENIRNIESSNTLWYILSTISIILLSCVFYLIYAHSFKSFSDSNTASTNIIKETEKGQKITMALPDGSTVKLNSGSRIIYPEVSSETVRRLELFGEGYFDIKNDSVKPFIIKASDLEVQVMGTSFNINNYVNKPVSISLMSGKLQVSTDDQQLYLLPGEKAVYEAANHIIHKQRWNYNQDLAWIDGVIYFENNTFGEVLDRLSLWYGVKFVLEGKPVTVKHYNALFRNESLKNVLENLSFTNQFTYKIINEMVTISIN